MLYLNVNGREVALECSLKAISEWEGLTQRPFLTKEPKDHDDTWLFIECMIQHGSLKLEDLTTSMSEKIVNYINYTPSATTIQSEEEQNLSIVTAEVIYAQMCNLGIDKEYENWHINKLLVLIGVMADQRTEKKPIPRDELLQRNARLNEERKKQLNTKG